MYPEGWLIDFEGENLLFFEQDPMNPAYEGYIEFWLVTGINSKEFKYRRRSSTTNALAQWDRLTKEGWGVIKEKPKAA